VSSPQRNQPCYNMKYGVRSFRSLVKDGRVKDSNLAPPSSVLFEYMILNSLIRVVVPGKFAVTALDKAALVMMLLGVVHVLIA
jgi:hypothetical protein